MVEHYKRSDLPHYSIDQSHAVLLAELLQKTAALEKANALIREQEIQLEKEREYSRTLQELLDVERAPNDSSEATDSQTFTNNLLGGDSQLEEEDLLWMLTESPSKMHASELDAHTDKLHTPPA